MRDLDLGRVLRALRRRRGWRQEDAAVRAGVDRSTWSRLEAGQLDRLTFATVRGCLAALEVRLDVQPRWRGADLERLLDEGHAALQAGWKERLERWGWQARAEVSYNRYGERGRIDLLAWYPTLRILLVVEIKTDVVDAQGLLGGLDAKARLAPFVARGLGWHNPTAVLPALVIADESTNRRRLDRIQPLFTHLTRRGKAGISWLRRPEASGGGLLIFSILSPARARHVKRVGRHRVRVRHAQASVDSQAPSPTELRNMDNVPGDSE
jgi:transcriptional regulator with XRE-family HTH domain